MHPAEVVAPMPDEAVIRRGCCWCCFTAAVAAEEEDMPGGGRTVRVAAAVSVREVVIAWSFRIGGDMKK